MLSKYRSTVENNFKQTYTELTKPKEENMNEKVKQMQDSLIVSCQALEHEPLHSSFIMGRMAKAAKEGGARGIRANTVEDILEIRKNVDLPVIGIIKRDYPDCDVYITPTMKEVDELMAVKPEIIALDATKRPRPDGKTLDEFFREVRRKYPDQLFMADCSSIEEALHADEIGFDFLGTTMVGYTPYTKDEHIESHTFEIIRQILKKAKHPVIAEGNIDTPEKAREVLDLGCYAVVVGGAITRPQNITRRFVEAVNDRPRY